MNWIQRKVYERVGLPSPETIERVRQARLEQAEYIERLVKTARRVSDEDEQRYDAAWRRYRDVD